MLYVVKLLYAWLLPPGLFILLLLLAHILFVKTRRTRYYFMALAVMYLLSITLVSDRLLKPLETYYAQPELSALRNADAIVVLGGGSVGGVKDFDGEGQAAADPANRLLMGIRLHRALKLPILVSGGQVFSYAGTEAEIEYRLLKGAGIGEAFILKEERTSGYHLPRSVLIFEREGVPVIPYPTDYKTNRDFAIDAFSFTPSAEAVRTSAIAMKEYLGILAVKLGAQ